MNYKKRGSARSPSVKAGIKYKLKCKIRGFVKILHTLLRKNAHILSLYTIIDLNYKRMDYFTRNSVPIVITRRRFIGCYWQLW